MAGMELNGVAGGWWPFLGEVPSSLTGCLPGQSLCHSTWNATTHPAGPGCVWGQGWVQCHRAPS